MCLYEPVDAALEIGRNSKSASAARDGFNEAKTLARPPISPWTYSFIGLDSSVSKIRNRPDCSISRCIWSLSRSRLHQASRLIRISLVMT
jgi:hypothetical protein